MTQTGPMNPEPAPTDHDDESLGKAPKADYQKSLAEMLAEAVEGENTGVRKLRFTEQCGAFAALYSGVRNFIVARAFGISLQATSYISGCLESDPDPYRLEYPRDPHPERRKEDNPTDLDKPRRILMDHNRNRSPNRVLRYQEVRREFEALGKDEFIARYYTARVHDRILIAKEQLRAEKQAKPKRVWKDRP